MTRITEWIVELFDKKDMSLKKTYRIESYYPDEALMSMIDTVSRDWERYYISIRKENDGRSKTDN